MARDRATATGTGHVIPAMNIIAWGNVAPWAEQRQIEQDLIISRAVIELFSDNFLKEEQRFRGGTALNKLHFPAAAAVLGRHRSRQDDPRPDWANPQPCPGDTAAVDG